jgi:hypothetical protein
LPFRYAPALEAMYRTVPAMSSSSPVLSAGMYDFSKDPSSLGSAFEFEIRLDAKSEGNTKIDRSQR